MANEKRLIYADSGQESVEYLKRHLIVGDSEFLRGYLRGVESLADGLAKLPPVDAVEVVRCLDCKHSTLPSLVTQRYGVPGTLTCHNHNSPCNKRNVKGECFCSYGERKDGDKL